MFRLCRRCAEEGVPVYFYGGAPEVLESLQARLKEQFPGLQVAGAYSPPFRPLSPEEDEAAVRAINSSGAGMVFLGLGYPKQDLFAHEHRWRIAPVQLCVGAAFDFHAGRTPRPPAGCSDSAWNGVIVSPRSLNGFGEGISWGTPFFWRNSPALCFAG